MGTADVHNPVMNRGVYYYPHFVPMTPDVCAANADVSEYKVGPQDILTIIVWNHPELTIPSMQTTSENVNIFTQTNQQNNNPAGILVDQHGEVFFSLAGRINVNGMTVEQIRQQITERLVKYIRKPQVSVRVASFRNKRGNIFHPTVFWLDMSSPGAMLMATQFKLKPRDVVIVSTAPVARYSRVINKILPTVQTFTNPPFQRTIINDN
jgi:hypothetical protein